MGAAAAGVRRSLRELEEPGHKADLDDLVRAWDKIQKLPPNDYNSFFRIGGYHGEPFEYRPFVDNLSSTDSYVYWGGYCHHGNVLFPVWHRAYLCRLEKALQSQVPGVMLPYWDTTSEESITGGLPKTLTDEVYVFANGDEIPNPLKSFTIPIGLKGDIESDTEYSKPAGYTTVRFPLSGLVGTAEARQETAEHNSQFTDPEKNTELLNENVILWILGSAPTNSAFGTLTPGFNNGVLWRYANSLNAPNYTAFSNTTSAAAWNRGNRRGSPGYVSSVESPHNAIHLSIGFDWDRFVPPTGMDQDGLIAGANGDMGETNTAALDPIFFFHHCNVDRMFYLWQKKNCKTTELDILEGYPGTVSTDSQGPTPGIAPGASLGMTTPLLPFLKDDPQVGVHGTKGMQVPMIGNDVVDIEKLGYSYSAGSFDTGPDLQPRRLPTEDMAGYVRVYGIDRACFEGSFVIILLVDVDNERYFLGAHPVFSRRDVVKCANCLTHMMVEAEFPLPSALRGKNLSDDQFKTVFIHRGLRLHPNVATKYEIVLATVVLVNQHEYQRDNNASTVKTCFWRGYTESSIIAVKVDASPGHISDEKWIEK